MKLKSAVFTTQLLYLFLLLLLSKTCFANTNEIIRESQSSVFRIIVEHSNNSIGMGTGFLINKNQIVTNYHVVKGAKAIFILDSNQKMKKAKLITTSQYLDLAVIEVPELSNHQSLFIADDGLINSPLEVWALGFPWESDEESKVGPIEGAKEITTTKNVISRIAEMPWGVGSNNKLKALKHGAAISPGSSGGPLLNACGSVVGINTSYVPDHEDAYFSLHIIEARHFFDKKNISYNISSNSCTDSLTTNVPLWVLLLSSGLGIIAIVLALKKPRTKIVNTIESFSHYLGRKPKQLRKINNNIGSLTTQKTLKLTGVLSGQPIFFLLVNNKVEIGRSRSLNDFCIKHSTVSRKHIRLESYEGEWGVIDLDSSNGTTINKKKLKPNVLYKLTEGRELCLGAVCLTVGATDDE